MKKLLKVLLWFFAFLLCAILCLVVYLSVTYNRLARELSASEKRLKPHEAVIFPSDSSSERTSENRELNLLPVPKKVIFSTGVFSFPSVISFSSPDSIKNDVMNYLSSSFGSETVSKNQTGMIQLKYNKALPVQGYVIDIKPGNILVDYSNNQGLYYAIVTLKVLKQNYSGKIPCVHIEDFPDLQVRGVMLDVSRNKIPSKETLKGIIQLLADMKYNHFELYTEGFSFAYPSFKNLWEGKETPLTGKEIMELDKFCKDHFIDLVPNQNSLGHMSDWLETGKYKNLAECPDGYKMLGLMKTVSTLNPVDPESIRLVSGMIDDLLPNFTSPNFNANLDEPFELGKGKSKELCQKNGVGEVYLDYAFKIHDIVTAKHKKMLMWGDIILRYPDLLPKIPKDVTLLDWGYESAYPYEKHCKTLQNAGVDYMVCPGTNSWTTITGRTDNMIATIENATLNGTRYGAKGMILTDWGDMGHWQYLPVSYAGYTVGATLSWNSGCKVDNRINRFLNSYVFKDKNSVMGNLVLDLGRYNRFEGFMMPNMTTTMITFEFGMRDKVLIDAIYNKVLNGITDLMKDLMPELTSELKTVYKDRHRADYNGLLSFLDSKENLLHKAKIETVDSITIIDEYQNAIRLIRLGTELQKYIDYRETMSVKEETDNLNSMKVLLDEYLADNHRLWLIRNKPGGYEKSIASLNSLEHQIDNRLVVLNKSSLSVKITRFLEHVGTAGAVLYLKSAS